MKVKVTVEQVHDVYRELTEYLIASHMSISTMESCTGGLIASMITDTEGASEILSGSVIAYSNEAKVMFHVPEKTLEYFGVYSQETAIAMAYQADRLFNSVISIGVTGTFANADPNNIDSIPGVIYYAIKLREQVIVYLLKLDELPSRFDYKLAVAYRVGCTLLELLRS